MKTLTEMKTLIINGRNVAAGSSDSLLRYAKRVVRKEKMKDPSISLIKGIIFKLENEV